MVFRETKGISLVAVLAAVVAALVATSMSSAAPTGKVADLFSGPAPNGTDIGDITVGNNATHLSIQIDLTGGWCMTDSHVAVAGTLAGIPQVNGNPQPGQFPFKANYSPCATTGSYSIPFTGLAQKLIAVHVTAWDPSSGATVNIVSDTTTNVTSHNGFPQSAVAAAKAYEPVGYSDCSGYQLSPTNGSVWDTHNGGSVSNDAGGLFDGATWIWPTSNPTTPNVGEYATFEKGINRVAWSDTAFEGRLRALNASGLSRDRAYGRYPGYIALAYEVLLDDKLAV